MLLLVLLYQGCVHCVAAADVVSPKILEETPRTIIGYSGRPPPLSFFMSSRSVNADFFPRKTQCQLLSFRLTVGATFLEASCINYAGLIFTFLASRSFQIMLFANANQNTVLEQIKIYWDFMGRAENIGCHSVVPNVS